MIPAFAQEAVKLAGLAAVAVVLPRVPLDAPGKGIDDLRAVWGEEFPVCWQAILDGAEPVPSATKSATLAVRLLRRESGAFARLDVHALEKARDRLPKLAAAFQDEALAFAEIVEIAADVLRITKAVFRAAAKESAEEFKREAAERAAEKALADLDIDGPHPVFFDGSAYWRREADEAFGKLSREDARLHLNKAGLSKNGDPSPCDAALHSLQVSNRVDYAGPFCGRPAGLHHENGMRVLATRGPRWINAVGGECPTITTLLRNLLGLAAGDEHAAKQFALFVSWLKLGREAVRNHAQHHPGQVLALVGPKDCGKSLVQSEIITPALGGRSADPGLFYTGKTTFNADLWAAEHLVLGDKALDVDGAQRSTLRNELKRAVAETIQPLHGKCRDGLSFRPVGRISLSANSDPESASNLPALDASFADKIIYLFTFAPPVPFFDASIPGARETFATNLKKELPCFLGSVDAFEIPAELRKARFGVTEWHHPAVLALLDEGDPLRPLAEVMEGWIDGWPEKTMARELPTVDLYRALDDHHGGKLSRLHISTGPKHLGQQLSKLSAAQEWQGLISRTSRRHGGRQLNRKQACWRIQKGVSS